MKISKFFCKILLSTAGVASLFCSVAATSPDSDGKYQNYSALDIVDTAVSAASSVLADPDAANAEVDAKDSNVEKAADATEEAVNNVKKQEIGEEPTVNLTDSFQNIFSEGFANVKDEINKKATEALKTQTQQIQDKLKEQNQKIEEKKQGIEDTIQKLEEQNKAVEEKKTAVDDFNKSVEAEKKALELEKLNMDRSKQVDQIISQYDQKMDTETNSVRDKIQGILNGETETKATDKK